METKLELAVALQATKKISRSPSSSLLASARSQLSHPRSPWYAASPLLRALALAAALLGCRASFGAVLAPHAPSPLRLRPAPLAPSCVCAALRSPSLALFADLPRSLSQATSMSGITVDDAVISHYNASIKPGSAPGAWMTMQLNSDKTKIVLDQHGDHQDSPNATHAALVASLPPNGCRYAVLDFKSARGSDGQREKICFITWAPDTSGIKEKMLIASTKDAVKKNLEGVQIEVQATDEEEIALGQFEAAMDRFK